MGIIRTSSLRTSRLSSDGVQLAASSVWRSAAPNSELDAVVFSSVDISCVGSGRSGQTDREVNICSSSGSLDVPYKISCAPSDNRSCLVRGSIPSIDFTESDLSWRWLQVGTGARVLT